MHDVYRSPTETDAWIPLDRAVILSGTSACRRGRRSAGRRAYALPSLGMHNDLKVDPGETLEGLDFEFKDGPRATVKAVTREKE